MAARVFRTKRAQRAQFRKLAFGQLAWAASDITVAPVVKYDRTSTLKGYSASTGKPTSDTVTDKSTVYIKVPRGFTGQSLR